MSTQALVETVKKLTVAERAQLEIAIKAILQKREVNENQVQAPTNEEAASIMVDTSQGPITLLELRKRRWAGVGAMRGQIMVKDNFSEPLEGFEEYR